jgi:hypothetical protein
MLMRMIIFCLPLFLKKKILTRLMRAIRVMPANKKMFSLTPKTCVVPFRNRPS